MEYLKGTEGNILLTTGSNKLGIFKTLPGYTDRVYVRALSTAAVARAVAETGLEGPHMILMQGPYSEDLNYDMLLHVGAKYMVTKDSGVPGGFDEKVRAAKRAGAVSVVIGRPPDDVGMGYRDVSFWDRASRNSRVPPRRTRCWPPRGQFSPGCATSPANRPSCSAARVISGSAPPPSNAHRVCGTPFPSGRSCP